MVGSPPENCTTSGVPSVRTKSSSIDSTSSSVRLNPGPAVEKHRGHCMLQTLFTSMIPRQAAVMRTSVRDRTAKCQRNGARFVELTVGHIRFRIAVHERLERPARRAPLAHVDLVLSHKHLCDDHPPADRTD